MTVNKDDRGLTDALNHGPVPGPILVSISTESADRYTWKTVRRSPLVRRNLEISRKVTCSLAATTSQRRKKRREKKFPRV